MTAVWRRCRLFSETDIHCVVSIRDADEQALLDPSVEGLLDRAFTARDCFRPEDGGVRTPWDIDERYQKSFRKKVDDEIARVLAELGKPKELSAEQQAALAKPGGGEIFQDRTFTFMGTPQVLRITINHPIASEKQESRSR